MNIASVTHIYFTLLKVVTGKCTVNAYWELKIKLLLLPLSIYILLDTTVLHSNRDI